MIKVHESLLKIIEEKAYHNNIEFTGIGYSSVYRPGLSNSVEYGYIEKEFIDGFETGFYTHYYPEHRICMRYTIDKSSLSKSNFIGKFETFYIDGQICEIGEFVNNKLHGNYECFYEDGRQFITATFNKDSFTGYGKSYYRNGVICEEGTITDVPNFTKNLELRLYFGVTPTKIDGIFMDYNIPYSDHFLNELMYSEQCDDFRLNSNYKVRGDYKAYNVEGKIIAWIKDSIKQTFDIKGQRLFVGAYNEFGQEHGQIIKYNYGHIHRIESYINGKLDGIFLEFNYEGFLKSKGEYLNGSKAGNWITYYENGLMKSETKYLNSSQYS
jgi:antitoxin component YwqK of YwqJK toxin-antitoxin module